MDIQTITLLKLSLAFIPVAIVIIVLARWQMEFKTSIYAMGRMLVQLLLIGYFLTYIFESEYSAIVIAVLAVMLFASSWIGLRTLAAHRKQLYVKALGAISIGGGLVLVLITQGVLALHPWYLPSYMIPLAGMIFASSMNSVSLAGERLASELNRGGTFVEARKTAVHAALIPITNSLFAVGLVSLPGMMTGQILSGVSPFIAARYQIMVMCMLFGAAGISAVLFLIFSRSFFEKSGFGATSETSQNL